MSRISRKFMTSLHRTRSYDEVAETYERVNAPLMFDAPARALVGYAAIGGADRVLDVGAGTGAVSRAVVGAGAKVVALDPSVNMLMAAQRGGASQLVCGALPDLPFFDGVFDAVLSAFVMTHVDDPEAAAREIHRVLQPGGRVALSAWSPAEDEYSVTWANVAHEFVSADVLNDAAQRVLPGEPRFSQRDGMAGLLEANGFASVRTETRVFGFMLNLEQMITTREVCASGRALHALLSNARWEAYRVRVRDVLGNKFPGGICFDRSVFIALGQKR